MTLFRSRYDNLLSKMISSSSNLEDACWQAQVLYKTLFFFFQNNLNSHFLTNIVSSFPPGYDLSSLKKLEGH